MSGLSVSRASHSCPQQTESPLSPFLTATQPVPPLTSSQTPSIVRNKGKVVPEHFMQALLAGRNLSPRHSSPAGSSQEQNDDCAYLGQTLKREALWKLGTGWKWETMCILQRQHQRDSRPALEFRASSVLGGAMRRSEESCWNIARLLKSDCQISEHSTEALFHLHLLSRHTEGCLSICSALALHAHAYHSPRESAGKPSG